MKFKDLQKLGKQIAAATSWAEQIRDRIKTDLESIIQLKDIVAEQQTFVKNLSKQLEDAEDTLQKLFKIVE